MTITINGHAHQVAAGANLLQFILEQGHELPYFCWHPALGAIGACRQCAVRLHKDSEDTRGRIVMACMTATADGQRVVIDDPEAIEFRRAIIEWLMTNHPHDCPICDEGGECHLQDMTVLTGHLYRRTRFPKRTFHNQELGPFVNHEMNRCIQCHRCVRFYADFAGGRDLQPFASRNRVWFGRCRPGKLESPFSGNLVEVCPTGVFTDKTLKQHYTRKWDLQSAPSICVHCSLGCNISAGERYGLLRRVLNRYHGQVNGNFLCDRGRFGYGFVNQAGRIRRPLTRRATGLEPVDRPGALELARQALAPGRRLIGIGSPRASLEANFLLRRLVGPERFCNGMAAGQARLVGLALELLARGPAASPSLRQIERCDAVLVLGEDLTASAPLAALALRQSVRQQPLEAVDRARLPRWDDASARLVTGERRGPLFVATPAASAIDPLATRTLRAAPAEIARLGWAVARRLDPQAPEPAELDPATAALADEVAAALKNAKQPLVISGTGLGSRPVLEAAWAVAASLCAGDRKAGLFLVLPECNSAGVSLLEPAGLDRALELAQAGADGLVILENDLSRRLEPARLDELLAQGGQIVVLDHSQNPTSEAAWLVLPAGSFAESSGSLVNNEGRAQRFYQVFPPGDDVVAGFRWLLELGRASGRTGFTELDGLDAVVAALAAELPIFAPLASLAPSAGTRLSGQKVPRQPQRYSGRTAMQAHIQVSEPGPSTDPDSPLSFSMEGHPGPVPAELIARTWAPGWNSAQAATRLQQPIGGPLRGGDPGRRLFEPAADPRPGPAGQPPARFAPRPGELLVVGVPELFGSEELSAKAPEIGALVPEARLRLRPDDASALGIQAGARVRLHLAAGTWTLAAAIDRDLPAGVAAAPVGLPGQPAFELPALARLEPA